VNALLGGQVDAITDIPFAQVDVVKAHAGLSVLESPGGGWLPLCLAIDIPPFNDNNVRQAFRLIVDRQAFVNQVLSRHGRVANDPHYYGDQYLKLGFSVDFWGTRSYLPQVANGSIPTAPYNETHWPPKDSNYLTLYKSALAETDPTKRCSIVHDMQKLEYDQ